MFSRKLLSIPSRGRSALAKAFKLPTLARMKMPEIISVARDEDSNSQKQLSSPTFGGGLAAVAAAAPIVTGIPAQALSVGGPLFYFYLQTSGLSTCKKIAEDGTTGSFSPAQFISLYTNGTVWVVYGLLAQDMTVLVPNSTAVLFGLYYTSQFAKYHNESMMKWYAGSAAIVGGTCVAAATMPNALDVVGMTGCVMAVILLSSPLAVMGKVIKEKSTAALPFGASLAGFLNASTWFAYGSLVAMDPYIYAPNGMGMAACAVQLSLFGIYGFPKEAKAESIETPETAKAEEATDEDVKPKA